MSSNKTLPTLKIVTPATLTVPKPGLVTSLPPPLPKKPTKESKNTTKTTKGSKKVESEDEMSDIDEEEESSSEFEEGFYVELSLTSTNEDGEPEDKRVIFNFTTENSYVENGENGYEDLEGQFEDAIATNYPGWTYAGEWEEYHVHGTDLPEDNDSPVVDVQ